MYAANNSEVGEELWIGELALDVREVRLRRPVMGATSYVHHTGSLARAKPASPMCIKSSAHGAYPFLEHFIE